jgi:ABC-2 type transport system permease protein
MTAVTSTTSWTRRPRPGIFAAFGDTTRMEWIKLSTVRSTGWLLGLLVVGVLGVGILLMALSTPDSIGAENMATFDPTLGSLSGLMVAELVMSVLGVLVITGEYSSGMIRATLAAVPDRPLLLAAKAAVLGAVTVAAGEALAFIAFFAGQAVAHEGLPTASLGDPGVLRAVLFGGVYPVYIALTALGIGALIRNTAGAIAAGIGWFFLLPRLVYLIPHHQGVLKFLPNEIMGTLASAQPQPGELPTWAGLLMLCLYAAAALAIGGLVMSRRDA